MITNDKDYSDKSYVGMSTCFYCGEPKEILLDRRLRNSLPREACYNYEPCQKCKDWMKQGIILISVSDKLSVDKTNPYRTGGWAVLREEAIKSVFPPERAQEVLERRVAFITDEAWELLGLPRKEK